VDSGNGIVATSTGIEVSETGDWSSINRSGRTIASWNWKAGGTAVSNTDGSITSQVSANTDAGFSIVEWTYSASNNTVGHGLGAPVDMIITKDRVNAARNWAVWHKDLGDMASGYYLNLNNTNASTSYSTLWGQSSASSTTFGQGVGLGLSGSQIAYCFANTDTTKVGSYTGNGSTDGPFVYTGFRPAWVMIKRTNSAAAWYMYDEKRDEYNVVEEVLQANGSAAEITSADNTLDFLSNGFKLRGSGGTANGSGDTYIFLAFASTSFKFSPAR